MSTTSKSPLVLQPNETSTSNYCPFFLVHLTRFQNEGLFCLLEPWVFLIYFKQEEVRTSGEGLQTATVSCPPPVLLTRDLDSQRKLILPGVAQSERLRAGVLVT